MAPHYARTIIKRHITRISNLVETYKSTEMTLEAFIEVEKLEKKLDGFYKTYYDADLDTMIQTMDEVIFAKINILKKKT
jgi:hypothetical protein